MKLINEQIDGRVSNGNFCKIFFWSRLFSNQHDLQMEKPSYYKLQISLTEVSVIVSWKLWKKVWKV